VPSPVSRHQDAQPPPSPRVGEGGRGDEGQKARECSKPRIAPKNATRENTPVRRAFPARHTPGSARLARVFPSITPGSARLTCMPSLTGGGFWGSPCVPSSVSGIRTPNLPLLPVWEKGAGGMRGKRRGNAANRASRPRTLPVRTPPSAARSRRATPLGARASRPHALPYRGRFLGKPLRAIFRFQASGRPTSPFSPCGLKGGGFAGRLSTVSVPPNARADPSVS
jgi:hypothetical protein